MSNVELPGVVLAAKLHALPEDLLYLMVVLHVPVDLGLGHQNWNVAGMGMGIRAGGLLQGGNGM